MEFRLREGLVSLEVDLRSFELSFLPLEITSDKYVNIKRLDLSKNPIRVIPMEFVELKELKTCFFPKSLISPPREIIRGEYFM